MPTPISGKTLAVCGILADKDAAGIVSDARPLHRRMVVRVGRRQRAAAAARRWPRWCARRCECPVSAADNVASACAAALTVAASASDRIVVFGSFHTVGPGA